MKKGMRVIYKGRIHTSVASFVREHPELKLGAVYHIVNNSKMVKVRIGNYIFNNYRGDLMVYDYDPHLEKLILLKNTLEKDILG